MTDSSCLDFVRRAVAQICRSAGWNCISQSAHDTLTDILLLRVESAAKIAQNFSQQSSRVNPTVDDVAFSFQQLGVALSKFFPQARITVDDDNISAVWNTIPGAFLATSSELNQEELSLVVDRDELENTKGSSYPVTDETNYQLQGADHINDLESGLEQQKMDVCTENETTNGLCSTYTRDNNGIQPVVHATEVADPWSWPSSVNVLDVTDVVPSTVTKPLSKEHNKEAEEAKLDVVSTVQVDDLNITSKEISRKMEDSNRTEKAVAPGEQSAGDQGQLLAGHGLQHQTVNPPVEHAKRASHVDSANSEEAASGIGVKASQYKIPKLKLKVGSHALPTSSVKEVHQPVMASSVAKDPKMKKKKRKNKDMDDVRGVSASGKLPKKSKHKDKNFVPSHSLVPANAMGNTTLTAVPPMAYQTGVQHGLQSFPSQPSVVSQTIPFEYREAVATQSSEYHCPVCGQSDMDGIPWITCDRCNNDVWYHLLCVGLVHEPLSDEKWFCPKCQKKINKQAKQQAKYHSHAM